ncbi:hypothetical protein AVEN_114913-1 [Araneus ventricosus]|uniref:Uncharacterized protein n=1 Tax=Araneus ventricosus TaxID=182803 RepID=A0A4Y2RNE0_ARAVE|nr:hypothetical protein AVEN_114913-1 [Araneus ventricosus]
MCRRVTSDSLVQSEPSKVTMVLHSSTECLYACRIVGIPNSIKDPLCIRVQCNFNMLLWFERHDVGVALKVLTLVSPSSSDHDPTLRYPFSNNNRVALIQYIKLINLTKCKCGKVFLTYLLTVMTMSVFKINRR